MCQLASAGNGNTICVTLLNCGNHWNLDELSRLLRTGLAPPQKGDQNLTADASFHLGYVRRADPKRQRGRWRVNLREEEQFSWAELPSPLAYPTAYEAIRPLLPWAVALWIIVAALLLLT